MIKLLKHFFLTLIFVLTIIIAGPTWAWDEPLAVANPDSKCEEYSNQGYDFYDSWIWKYGEKPIHEACFYSFDQAYKEASYSLTIGCHRLSSQNKKSSDVMQTIRIGKKTCIDEKDMLYKLDKSERQYSCTRLTQSYEFFSTIPKYAQSILTKRQLVINRYSGKMTERKWQNDIKWLNKTQYKSNGSSADPLLVHACIKLEQKF